MTTEMYFVCDIESDGDCPGTSSMLSIGVVAMHPQTSADVADFYTTLKRLPDARPMNETMEWWDKFPKQWAEARESPVEPKEAIQSLENFVKETLKANKADVPVFVASPAGFDFSYVYYYLHRFLGRSIFGFSALDLKSYCMALSGCPYLQVKRQRKPEWISDLPHTHNALEDARQQADEFRKILKWRREHLLVPKALKQEEIVKVTKETVVEPISGRIFAPCLPPNEYWIRHYSQPKGSPAYRINGFPCIYASEEAARNMHRANNLSQELVIFSINCLGDEREIKP